MQVFKSQNKAYYLSHIVMSFSSKDQLEELQYNVDNAIPDVRDRK